MAIVIAVVNSKGGVGKTTLAVNLAEAFRLEGQEVLLIDNDQRQGSAARWSDKADAAGRQRCQVWSAEGPLGSSLLTSLRASYDVILIDAPGYLDTNTTALVALADVVLMPIQPSALDLWACEQAIEWIRQRQLITGGTPRAWFVPSRCSPDERVNRQDMESLTATGIPILTARTVQRVHYARTLALGGTVFDLPYDDKARGEITAIQEELTHGFQ